jgi:hypothetical protein
MVVLFAALAVLLASTAYVSHLHKPEAQTGSGGQADHCELCLQLDRVAGAVPSPTEVVHGVTYTVGVIIAGAQLNFSVSVDRAQQARAPPRS